MRKRKRKPSVKGRLTERAAPGKDTATIASAFLDVRQGWPHLPSCCCWVCAGGVNAARRKRRPPLQEYIRHLIFVELNEQSITDVLKRLLRLPWAECERWVLRLTWAECERCVLRRTCASH